MSRACRSGVDRYVRNVKAAGSNPAKSIFLLFFENFENIDNVSLGIISVSQLQFGLPYCHSSEKSVSIVTCRLYSGNSFLTASVTSRNTAFLSSASKLTTISNLMFLLSFVR